MPKQLDDKQKRRALVNAYHKEMLRVVNIVRNKWQWDDVELQEFLDDDNNILREPVQFREFREAWESAIIKGKKAGVFQRSQLIHNLKIIAKEFWSSKARLDYYSGALGGRIRCMSKDGMEPVSALELEQLYQYLLYKKGCEQNDLDPIPYRTWLSTPFNVTFYGKLH